MSLVVSERKRTFPKSVQPGIPKLPDIPKGYTQFKFGDLFDVVQRPVKLADQEEYDLVTVKRARGGIEHRATMFGAKIAVKSQYYLSEGDFLISKRQIVHGACGIVTKDFEGSIVSNEYSVLRCKSVIDLEFLRYLTNTIYFQQTCFHSSIGVHIEKMIFKLDEWFKWPINLPSLPEQKKIADFLGVVDAKIAALRARQAGLARYKRGLMQALFSQRLRFTKPDGTPFPDWEEKRLGEVLTIGSGRDYKHLAEGIVPVYGTGGYMTSVDQYLYDGESVCIGRKGTIDNPVFLTGKFWTVDTLFYTHSFNGVSPYFMFIIFQQINWKKHNEASGVPSLSKATIEKLKFQLPHPDEQTKIAEALSALDAKIQAVAAQVAQMEQFKKGLLQQMFV